MKNSKLILNLIFPNKLNSGGTTTRREILALLQTHLEGNLSTLYNVQTVRKARIHILLMFLWIFHYRFLTQKKQCSKVQNCTIHL